MEQGEKRIKERPADSHKKGVIYVCTLGTLLLVTVCYTVLTSNSRDEKKQAENEPKKYVINHDKIQERKAFDKMLELEDKRRSQEIVNQKSPRYDLQEMVKSNNNTGSRSGLIEGTTANIDEKLQQWHYAEKIRALDSSHKSSLKIEPINYDGEESNSQSYRKPLSIEELRAGQHQTQNKLSDVRSKIALNKQKQQELQKGNISSLVSQNPFIKNNAVLQKEAEKRVVGLTSGSGQEIPEHYKLIPRGTVIAARLDQELMSDYVGSWRAKITKDVYDIDGEHILIPKNSNVIGKSLRISNVNEPIQARMGLTVEWVVLPNGKSISFKNTSALDSAGVGAIKDKVNYHFIAQFLGVGAYALLTTETDRNDTSLGGQTSLSGDIGSALRSQFAPLAQRYLSLVPTITLRSGTPVNIFLEDDVYAESWKYIYADYIAGY